MTFLSPWLAVGVAGVAVPLLVLMYFLKLRRQAMSVSSTLLWRRSIHDIQVNSPFQKLKRNLLLLLQLLVMAAILLALARPTLNRPASGSGGPLILVIDRSASMNATDEKPTRLQKAKRLALERLEMLQTSARQAGSGVMVIALGDRAQVVQPMTLDRTLARRAIESIQPSDHRASLGMALELIQPYLAGSVMTQAAGDARAVGGATGGEGGGGEGGRTGGVEIYSDGRFADAASDRPSLPDGVAVLFHVIGREEKTLDNLGIVAIAAKRDAQRPSQVQVLARLLNSSAQAVTANVSLSVDGRVRQVRPVSVASWQQQAVLFDVAIHGSALLTVKHDHADQLASDDQASLNLVPPRTLRVALISDAGNPFLEHAIKAAGVQKLTRWSSGEYENQQPQRLKRTWSLSREEGYDLLVFDRYGPKRVPPVPSLSFACSPPLAGLKRLADSESDQRAVALLDWQRDQPLLNHVSLEDVLLVQPGRWVLPAQARALARTPSGPVLAELTDQQLPHVVASFDPLKSNWPMQVGFAVFIRNALEQLSLSSLWSQGVQYHPGDVVLLPAMQQSDSPLVYLPPPWLFSDSPAALGGQEPIMARHSEAASTSVLPVDRVGIYRSQARLTPPWDQLPVNLASELESDLRSATQLSIGAKAATTAASSGDGWVRQEIWRWLALLALGLLMLEWLVYCRRLHA